MTSKVKNLTSNAKDLTSKAKDLDSKANDMTSKAKVKDWTYKAKEEAAPRLCLVDVTISTYIHNTNPAKISNKAHKAKRIKTKGFTSKAKHLTTEAKAKDMTSCPGRASSPRPWPWGLHLWL